MHRIHPTFILLLGSGLLTTAGGSAADGSIGATARPPEASITPAAAIASAVNELTVTSDEIRLRHPRHQVVFTPQAVTFAARRGPEWRWTLDSVSLGASSVDLAVSPSVAPRLIDHGCVAYPRGPITETYVARSDCVEQRFEIVERVGTDGADLTIVGRVACSGSLLQAGEGWVWADEQGVVSLGGVRVFDASGKQLPASMSVVADETRIRVDGRALVAAAYPVTIDPEIGTNDFRISEMGVDGDVDYDAYDPDVAYNPVNNEYLVVWSADDDAGTMVTNEYEILVQRIDAATGLEVGVNDQRISDMGPDGDPFYDAVSPAVAYNSVAGEYLVVWAGEDDGGDLVLDEREIFGQRLTAATGAEIGTNDFRISEIGTDGDEFADAIRPDVAFSSLNNEYLVIWDGDPGLAPFVDNEYEIFGQRLSGSTGAQVGTNDFRISDMGPDGDPTYDARRAAVVYNSVADQYLVVWEGDDTGLAPQETEIFGQRILASSGLQVGTNDFRISDMGPDGDPLYDAVFPEAAFDASHNEYLVVWAGDDNTAPLVEGEREIFGQFLDGSTGAPLGANDFRITDVGPDGSPVRDAALPRVCFNAPVQEYLVTWEGDDDQDGGVDDDFEIYGQRISALTRTEVGVNDFRISQMGPDTTSAGTAHTPAVVCANADYLVVWSGDDTNSPGDEVFEIYGQAIDGATGNAIGADDFPLSDVGTAGDVHWDGKDAAVAYSSLSDEFFVVWHGNDNEGGVDSGENEIWGRRVTSGGLLLGPDKIRLSDMGPDGDPHFGAIHPAVTYNTWSNEYLVVWAGDDNVGGLIDGEFEIFGQRVDAATGGEVGVNDFRISDMGTDGSALYDAASPDLAYSQIHNEYLVVWAGDDNVGGLVDGEWEVFGQRLAADGTEVGTNDFRISAMGPDGDPLYDAEPPAMAYNDASDEYLVIWAGEDNEGGLLRGEFEIFCQRISGATGAEIGNDYRISDMGGIGDVNYDAELPDVAFEPNLNEYLVVWSGDDLGGSLVNEENEVFGQRLAGATGQEIGENDFRISIMGPDGDPLYDGKEPSVACDPDAGFYLVVWHGDDDAGFLGQGEYEIFGRLIDAGTGQPLGADDFRLSDMGVDGDVYSDAFRPAVAGGGPSHRFLVAWDGDDATEPLVNDEFEIYGQIYLVLDPSAVPEEESTQRMTVRLAPQPAQPTSVLEWESGSVAPAGPATISVFDIQGRTLRHVAVEPTAASHQRLAWRDLVGARSLASGSYFVEVRTRSGRVGVTRVLVLR